MTAKKQPSAPPAEAVASGRTARAGYTLLAAPPGHTGLSLGGESCDVVDGVVEVPDAHVSLLLERGYTRVSTE